MHTQGPGCEHAARALCLGRAHNAVLQASPWLYRGLPLGRVARCATRCVAALPGAPCRSLLGRVACFLRRIVEHAWPYRTLYRDTPNGQALVLAFPHAARVGRPYRSPVGRIMALCWPYCKHARPCRGRVLL